jgi:hypothetical protein
MTSNLHMSMALQALREPGAGLAGIAVTAHRLDPARVTARSKNSVAFGHRH